MQAISNLLQQPLFEVKAPNNERATILKEFVDAINAERKEEGYPRMVTGRGVAMKCAHLKNNFELYSFLSNCKDYKNRGGKFGRMFFGALKVK